MIDPFLNLNAGDPRSQLRDEEIEAAGFHKCFDCGTLTKQWVMEKRQTSGPCHNDPPVVYAGDFSEVFVHADRRDCIRAKKISKLQEMRAKDPFYDVPAC